jgi:hypothetical protein
VMPKSDYHRLFAMTERVKIRSTTRVSTNG